MFGGDKMIQRWEGNRRMSKVQYTQHKDFVVVIFTWLDIRRRMGEDGLLVRCSHH
jgi:hypothetical protein